MSRWRQWVELHGWNYTRYLSKHTDEGWADPELESRSYTCKGCAYAECIRCFTAHYLEAIMESLHTALSAVNVLRSNVWRIFEILSGGVCIQQDENEKNEFLHELQELLILTNTNLSDVEATIKTINDPLILSLGSSSYLCQEVCQDRQALYPQLVNSYNWIDRIREYASASGAVLHANPLKRCYNNTNKRKKPSVSSNLISPRTFDNTMIDVARLKILKHMKIEITRPIGNNAVVYITLGRVLRAKLIFNGIKIEWVIVKGYDEQFIGDMWAESQFVVFRKIQDHSQAAMINFYSPTIPELALQYFLIWLNSYMTLFYAPCKKCGNRLLNGCPPTWRDFRSLEPSHVECM